MNTQYIKQLFIEAIVVGIITVVVGSIISRILMHTNNLKQTFQSIPWNNWYTLEWSYFITGVFIHLLCEVIGINKWYLTYSAAAML